MRKKTYFYDWYVYDKTYFIVKQNKKLKKKTKSLKLIIWLDYYFKINCVINFENLFFF